MHNDTKSVDDYLDPLPEWQRIHLQNFRKIIHDVSDEVTEEIKWGVPAFMYKSKATFTMAAFKNHTKYNFILNGAQLSDPNNLFNNGLESVKSRSIDIHKGESVDTKALKDLAGQTISKIA